VSTRALNQHTSGTKPLGQHRRHLASYHTIPGYNNLSSWLLNMPNIMKSEENHEGNQMRHNLSVYANHITLWGEKINVIQITEALLIPQ